MDNKIQGLTLIHMITGKRKRIITKIILRVLEMFALFEI